MSGSIIGINAGGTRTVCLLADSDGRVLREWRGAGANLQSEGEAGVERVLHEAIEVVADHSRSIEAVCVGMAGVDREEDLAAVRAVLERVVSEWPQRAKQARHATPHLVIVNDALIALEAGAPATPGSVLIAGTGSIAYGRDASGRAARAGGWGYVLGDEGSGYWLGRQALRAVVKSADGRGPQTMLAARVLSHYGFSKPTELVRQMSGHGAKPAEIARLAPIVGAAADAGDQVAQHLVAVAAAELASAAESVVRRLGLDSSPLLMTGGVLTGFERLRGLVVSEIRARMPGVEPALLRAEPAIGAVRLASEALRGELRLPRYDD